MTSIYKHQFASDKVLREANYENAEQLFHRLEGIDQTKFLENNLVAKQLFINRLKSLIRDVDRRGEEVREAQSVTASGSIFEGMRSDYLCLRGAYLQKRKLLKKQLNLIDLLFSEKYY